MWALVYDKWEEKWIVSEFERAEPLDAFFWFREAEAEALRRNTRSSMGGDLHFADPCEVWPGGACWFGESQG